MGREEALERYPEWGRKDTAYAAARAAGLANKFTAQEHLLGAIFGKAPSLEELSARTPEDIARIIKEEGQKAQLDTKRMVSTTVSRLTYQERTVLRLRFGLEDGKSRTVKEVGNAIGKSPSTVYRIERRAFDKLKTPQTQP